MSDAYECQTSSFLAVARHSALFWTNTHEEHWPGGAGGSLCIIIRLLGKCSTKVGPYQTSFNLKRIIKGVPHNNPDRVRSAHLWNITPVAETKGAKVEQNTRLERSSLPPFTKYIGALN